MPHVRPRSSSAIWSPLVIFSEEYKSEIFSLYYFLHISVISTFLRSVVFLTITSLKALCLCFSLDVSDRDSHPSYKKEKLSSSVDLKLYALKYQKGKQSASDFINGLSMFYCFCGNKLVKHLGSELMNQLNSNLVSLFFISRRRSSKNSAGTY